MFRMGLKAHSDGERDSHIYCFTNLELIQTDTDANKCCGFSTRCCF